MRVIASLRKTSGSITYVATPRSRRRPWIDGAFTYARASILGSSKYEPRRLIAGPQRSIWVTCSNSSSQTKYAMFPCSCGVRAVWSVVMAAAVVDGNTVVASISCAASRARARWMRCPMNGVPPSAQNRPSGHPPRTEVGFVDARAALDALGGVLDSHVGRTGALEDGAGLFSTVERVAYDSHEHVSARDLILALGRLSLLEQTRAPGEPADERQSDDDRERAERS